jgi:glycosyltransferase involved in cell wall biosynthesis
MDNHQAALLAGSGKSMEGLRVLVVDLSIRYGGASARTIAIAQSLLPAGGMIAGIENSPVVRIAQDKGIPVRVIAKRRMDPMIPFRLARVVREDGIQVVDTQNIQSKFWVSLAALLADFAFVSTLNSFYRQEHGTSWKSWFYHSLDLFTNWKTTRYIAVSETIRNGVVEDGISPELVDLIRNGVELDADSLSVDVRQVREQIGIPQDALLCVLVGRLVWAKGFDDFISAFSLAADKIKNIKAIILGEGELREQLEKQLASLGLQEKVLLPGYCDYSTVLKILMSSDLYVMSSRSEGIPFALLEAAALGLPIVATNCGGIPEVVTNGENALLVPVGDKSALAQSLVTLCEDRNLAKALGKNAREKIKQDYSLPVQMEATKNAYVKALHDRKR